MASFDDIFVIANDRGFQGRCQYAVTVASVNVMAEDPNTPGHATRIIFAKAVLRGGVPLLAVALSVLTNPTVAGEANSKQGPDFAIPDGDIQFVVNSLYNALSGVST